MSLETRLLLVSATIGVALLVAWWARRGVAVRRRSGRLPDGLAGPILFTSKTCATCSRARQVVSGLELEGLTELSWEDESDVFERAGVDRVPVLMWCDGDGRTWRVDGVASADRLRRWIRDP